eukprot:g6278.t1
MLQEDGHAHAVGPRAAAAADGEETGVEHREGSTPTNSNSASNYSAARVTSLLHSGLAQLRSIGEEFWTAARPDAFAPVRRYQTSIRTLDHPLTEHVIGLLLQAEKLRRNYDFEASFAVGSSPRRGGAAAARSGGGRGTSISSSIMTMGRAAGSSGQWAVFAEAGLARRERGLARSCASTSSSVVVVQEVLQLARRSFGTGQVQLQCEGLVNWPDKIPGFLTGAGGETRWEVVVGDPSTSSTSTAGAAGAGALENVVEAPAVPVPLADDPARADGAASPERYETPRNARTTDPSDAPGANQNPKGEATPLSQLLNGAPMNPDGVRLLLQEQVSAAARPEDPSRRCRASKQLPDVDHAALQEHLQSHAALVALLQFVFRTRGGAQLDVQLVSADVQLTYLYKCDVLIFLACDGGWERVREVLELRRAHNFGNTHGATPQLIFAVGGVCRDRGGDDTDLVYLRARALFSDFVDVDGCRIEKSPGKQRRSAGAKNQWSGVGAGAQSSSSTSTAAGMNGAAGATSPDKVGASIDSPSTSKATMKQPPSSSKRRSYNQRKKLVFLRLGHIVMNLRLGVRRRGRNLWTGHQAIEQRAKKAEAIVDSIQSWVAARQQEREETLARMTAERHARKQRRLGLTSLSIAAPSHALDLDVTDEEPVENQGRGPLGVADAAATTGTGGGLPKHPNRQNAQRDEAEDILLGRNFLVEKALRGRSDSSRPGNFHRTLSARAMRTLEKDRQRTDLELRKRERDVVLEQDHLEKDVNQDDHLVLHWLSAEDFVDILFFLIANPPKTLASRTTTLTDNEDDWLVLNAFAPDGGIKYSATTTQSRVAELDRAAGNAIGEAANEHVILHHPREARFLEEVLFPETHEKFLTTTHASRVSWGALKQRSECVREQLLELPAAHEDVDQVAASAPSASSRSSSNTTATTAPDGGSATFSGGGIAALISTRTSATRRRNFASVVQNFLPIQWMPARSLQTVKFLGAELDGWLFSELQQTQTERKEGKVLGDNSPHHDHAKKLSGASRRGSGSARVDGAAANTSHISNAALIQQRIMAQREALERDAEAKRLKGLLPDLLDGVLIHPLLSPYIALDSEGLKPRELLALGYTFYDADFSE